MATDLFPDRPMSEAEFRRFHKPNGKVFVVNVARLEQYEVQAASVEEAEEVYNSGDRVALVSNYVIDIQVMEKTS